METVRKSLRRRMARLRQRRFQARLRRGGAELGPRVHVAIGSVVSNPLRLGRGTRINGPGTFKGNQPISLGNYCAVGEGVRMISSDHRLDLANLQRRLHRDMGLGEVEERGAPIRLGHNVWVGDAAIILKGVTVGNGAVIGAGAVLTRDVPAFAIAVGVPARVVGFRFDAAVIEALEDLAWWDWSEEELRARREVLALEPAILARDEVA